MQGGSETTGADGLTSRLGPGTRLLTSDLDARVNLWLDADALEHALERMLHDRLRAPLEFKPSVDWSNGLAASLKSQIGFLMHEMKRHDGVADNPVALASMTDLILSLALRGVPHNYLERLDDRRPGAVPAYVRRAEEFMRANAGAPIRMDHSLMPRAVASGHWETCSANFVTPRRSRHCMPSGWITCRSS